MSALQWMDVIYPWNAGWWFGYAIASLFYLFVVRGRVAYLPKQILRLVQIVIGLDVLLFLSEFAITFMLGQLTGENPQFDIDQYRVYVVWARGSQGVLLPICTVIRLLAVFAMMRSHGHK